MATIHQIQHVLISKVQTDEQNGQLISLPIQHSPKTHLLMYKNMSTIHLTLLGETTNWTREPHRNDKNKRKFRESEYLIRQSEEEFVRTSLDPK